jgi:hypothetical protein
MCGCFLKCTSSSAVQSSVCVLELESGTTSVLIFLKNSLSYNRKIISTDMVQPWFFLYVLKIVVFTATSHFFIVSRHKHVHDLGF